MTRKKQKLKVKAWKKSVRDPNPPVDLDWKPLFRNSATVLKDELPLKITLPETHGQKERKKMLVPVLLILILVIAQSWMNIDLLGEIQKQKQKIKSLNYQIIGETASTAFWKRERDLRMGDIKELRDYAWKLEAKVKKQQKRINNLEWGHD